MDRSVYQEAYDDSIAPSLLVQQPVLPVSERAEPPLLSPEELAKWRWANVHNLDLFLEDVYQYFLDKGFYSTILKRMLNLLTVLFVVSFAVYLGNCIDYSKLHGATTLADLRVQHCLAKTGFFTKLVLWIFGALWFLKLFQYVSDVRRLYEMKTFFEHLLHVNEQEIQTISWPQVVSRLVKLNSLNLAAAGRSGNRQNRALDAHNVANRIMRRDNYLIAMFNKNILNLNVQLPFVGDYQFLTTTLEWSISLCILDFAFNENGQIRPVFLNEGRRQMLADGLARRFRFAAIMNIVFAPVAIIYMTLYYFFRYFNEYHRDPASMGSRQYTPLAEWKLRELNELYHLFRRRLSMSTVPALRYISQFPREKNEIVLRFIIFVCGSFAAVLGMASIYDPELLGLEISPDKTVLFYIGIFGTIIAVARGMRASESEIFEPEAAMHQIVEFTHYLPEKWENKLHTEQVKTEFCQLYDLKIKIILRDLLSIVLNPVILWYNLPESSEKIVDFLREFTVHVDELGYVCSYAVFNFDQANKVKARANALDKYYSTADGKMLKSYLNFMDIYGPPQSRGIGRRDSLARSTSVREPASPERSQIERLDRHDRSDRSDRSDRLDRPQSERPDRLDRFDRPERGDRLERPQSERFDRPHRMEMSVMDQYDRLKLSPVQEESDTNNTELNLLPDDDEHDSVEGGVFGLLNKLAKTEPARH